MNHRYSGHGSESNWFLKHQINVVTKFTIRIQYSNLSHKAFFFVNKRPEIIRFRMFQKSLNQVH